MKTKFNIGDKVIWHDDYKRIDVITKVVKDIYSDVRYYTKETTNEIGKEPKIGYAYESYLTLIQ